MKAEGFWFRVSDFGFRVSGFGFRVSGGRLKVSGFGLRVVGPGFRMEGWRLKAEGLTVSQAHRRLHHSTQGLRVMKEKEASFTFLSAFVRRSPITIAEIAILRLIYIKRELNQTFWQ